jgi:hypothetical protein
MNPRAGAVLAAILTLLALSGCDIGKLPPYALPSLPEVVGVRVTGGELQVRMGLACPGVRRVSVLFGDAGAPEMVLATPNQWGVEVDRLSLDGPYPPGMQVTKPLPDGFDWRTAKKVFVDISSDIAWGGAAAELADVIDGSAKHPDDTYFFEKFGWLSPAEVAAKDGKEFLTLCTPDPRDEPKVPRAFGARVTDGRLQLWTGSRCLDTDQVILTFQPGQADLVVERDSVVGEEFERLTLGGPYPGFKIVQPLPSGFDWRTAKSLLLRVHADRNGFPSTTDLSEVLAGSADHPDDAYFFQGVGWLNRSEAAAKNTKDFLDTCTHDPARK